MPKPPKRPRDMMQLAKMVGELATGDAAETEPPKPTKLQERAAKGGKARAASLSRAARVKIAKKGGKASARNRR